MSSGSSSDSQSLAPARPRRGEILSYGLGRTCQRAGCPTLLSRYNAGELCWTHSGHFEPITKRDQL